MKLLIVTPEYSQDHGGGIGTYYRHLVPALRAQGCEVTVARGSAFTHGEAVRVEEGVKVATLESERYDRWVGRFAHFGIFPSLQRHLAAAYALHEQMSVETFDVVEVCDWGLLFLPWIIEGKTPALVQFHGSCGQVGLHERPGAPEILSTLELLLERSALSAAGVLSAYSRTNAAWWEAILGRTVECLGPPLQIVPTPVEPSAEWVTAGRIQTWKGPEVACQAWALLGAEAPLLRWYGRDTVDPASGKSLSGRLAEDFPEVWGEAIRPHPALPGAELQARIQAAACVVIPSTWDVFNLVTAEAMQLGRPVIAADVIGAADLIEDGVNGFTFPAGDAAALAATVRRVQGLSPETLRAIGRAAAETTRERLNPAVIATAKLDLYRKEIETPPTALPWLGTLLASAGGQTEALLEQLPLKRLLTHVAHRGMDKIRATFSRHA